MITSFRATGIVLSTLVGLAWPDALHAQTYPARSVTIVVPNAAGGGTDTVARLIGDQLAKQLGQSFVVENRTGGGMLVGTTAVAKAVPDGYTLLMGLNGNLAVNPSLFAKLPYDAVADFTPVAMLAEYPFLVVVNNELPVTSIKELVAYLKANPGKIDYASAGSGTGQHLAAELFNDRLGSVLGRPDTEPSVVFVAGYTCLVDCRQIRHQRRSVFRSDRKSAHLASFRKAHRR